MLDDTAEYFVVFQKLAVEKQAQDLERGHQSVLCEKKC